MKSQVSKPILTDKRLNFDTAAILRSVLLFTLTTCYVLVLFALVVAVAVLPFGNPRELLEPPAWVLPWAARAEVLEPLAIVFGPGIGITLLAAVIVCLTTPRVYRWLRMSIDDLIYGQHDDAFALLANVRQQLDQMSPSQAILPTLAATIAQTLKLPYVLITAQDADAPMEGVFGVAPRGATIESLPLRYHDNQIGELRVAARRADEQLSSSDLKVLSDLARQVGITLYAARITADVQRSRERIIHAREEERRRLRRDLHDGLGPQLASQTLTLDVIARQLHSNPDQAATLLLAVREQMQQAVSDLRELIYGLRPPVLDDLGLKGALEDFIDRVQQRGRPHISLHLSDIHPPLPAAVEVAAYRILQEAVTNVIRHAQASLCEVRLEVRNGDRHNRGSVSGRGEALPEAYLILEVSDNGIGIAADRLSGVGLQSMRERTAELGGQLTIETAASGGTHICAMLPIGNGGQLYDDHHPDRG
jgi:signal transduction histidine kinase